ncbi:MAG TPA: hypothetical protein DCL77_09400 [Prolixibacteraceae bacterium]|jgi:hypothetical protein|nr:hypothetical protein [Prolixibacteraceae bacterium]
MDDTIKSNSYLTYDEVIAKAQAIQPYFAADLPLFTAYDPWYTSGVNTELVSGIYIGLKYFSENSLIADIKRVTELIDMTFAAARECYEKLVCYVDLGFGDMSDIMETFGYTDFEKPRPSIRKMIHLLNKAHAAISQDDHLSRLLAAGMPEGLALEVANIAAELSAGRSELKILKKQHLLSTRERIDLFNSIWDTLSGICEDGKVIFADDPDRLEIYDLYDAEDWNVNQVEFMHLN